MNRCPNCKSEEKQVKSGFNRSGSQRWKCQVCGKRYTPEPKEHGYPEAMRLQAVRMYVDSLNYRRIGRHLGVDHKTVINWVNAYAAQLPDAPQPDDVNNAELDELYTFIQRKKTGSTSCPWSIGPPVVFWDGRSITSAASRSCRRWSMTRL